MPRKQRVTLGSWAEGLTDVRGLLVALGERSVKVRAAVVLEEDRAAAEALGHPVVLAADTYELVTLAEMEASNEGWGDEGTPLARFTALCGPQLARGRSWQETRREPAEVSPEAAVDSAGAVAAMAAGCVRMMREHTLAMAELRQVVAHREDTLEAMLERLVDARISQVEAEAEGVAALLEAAAEQSEPGINLDALAQLNETVGSLVQLAGLKLPAPAAAPAAEPEPSAT